MSSKDKCESCQKHKRRCHHNVPRRELAPRPELAPRLEPALRHEPALRPEPATGKKKRGRPEKEKTCDACSQAGRRCHHHLPRLEPAPGLEPAPRPEPATGKDGRGRGRPRGSEKERKCDACWESGDRCTHDDEFRMSPEGSMPFLKQSLVNPDNHEFDYTLNTVPNTSAEVNTLDEDDPEFNHTFNSFQKKSRKKKPLVDSVSEAVGALNLTATSLPRGFHESAHGRTGSGLADTFARFESPYDRSGDAILPNPAQQSSYKKLKATTKIGDNSFDSFKDYLKGDGKKRCTSRGFPAPHEVVKNYGAPGVRHHGKSPSPHAVENYEAWKKETFEEYIRATRARPASPAGPVGPWKNETSEDFNPKATHAKASRPQTIEGWQNETSEDFNPEATRPEASRPQKIEGWQHETSEDFNPKATRPEASRPQKIEGWETQTPKDFKRKAPRAEASFSSEGSKSPAYHAERRERETEQERRDQPGKSHGRKSRDGQPPTLQQSPYLPGPPPGHGSNAQAHETAKGKESKGKKSGDGGKHKDGKSKDDTQGGGHRRGDGSRRADRG